MRILTAIVLGLAVTGVACQKKEKKKELYTYDFTENNCPTGRHTFNSTTALCEGLADETRNNGCAYSSRLKMAKERGCPQVDPETQVFRTQVFKPADQGQAEALPESDRPSF